MSDVLADLYILLRAESGRMVTGFAEGGAAGEEMAASIAAATAEVDTRTAAMDAAVTSIGAAATDAAAVTAAGFTEVGLTAEQLATKIAVVSADVEAEIVALDTSLISIGQAADDAALANAAAMEKMRADTIAALTAMEAAEAQAAASTEAMAAKIDAAAASSTATTAGKMQALKTGALAVGVAAALVAGGSIKMAADFESATNRLVTSAGETEANLDGVRQGILSLAGQVGYSSEDLAAAMYKIESGGQHGAAGLDVLKASAQGAKAENADLTTVADAVTSVLQDYHLQASASADVTSKLVAATAAGKMTFEELSGSLSSVLPVASANHVALEDILGDISSMTVHGMSASQVTQNLSDTIRHMAAPTQQQSKELAALGMNAQQLSSDLGENGLYGVVQNISQAIVQRFSPDMQHVVISLKDALSKSTPAVQELGQKLLDGTMSAKQYNSAAKDMDVASQGQAMAFATLVKSLNQIGTAQNGGSEAWQSYTAALRGAMGDATGLNVALMLTGENSKTTADAIASIRGATTDAAGNVRGWSEIQGTFNQKMAEAKDGLGALAISIGTYLLPVVSAVAGAIATATQWMSQHKAVAEVLAIAVGVGLVIAFSALLAVFWGFAANPVTWIIAAIILAIGLLAVAVYEVISHWSSIVDFFAGIWHGIEDIFHTVVDAVVGFVKDWYPLILGVLSGGILLIPALIFKYWTQIGDFIGSIWNSVVDFLGGVWSWIAETARSVWGGIAGFFVGIWNTAYGAVTTAWNAITGALVGAWNAIVSATKPIWEPIVHIIGDIFEILKDIVVIVVGGILILLKMAWEGVVLAAKTYLMPIVNFFTWLWSTIKNAATSAWDAITGWLKQKWDESLKAWHTMWDPIINFAKKLWDDVSNAFRSAWNALTGWLAEKWDESLKAWHTMWDPIAKFAKDLWDTVSGAFRDAWNNVTSWLKQKWDESLQAWHTMWDPIAKFAKDLWDTVSGVFRDAWNTISDAVKNGIDTAVNWVKSLPGRILDGLGNIGSLLWNAGSSIITGFLHGLESAFDAVKNFVGGIADWISAHKGPIGYDATLLTPHGGAIMGGLLRGLQAGAPAVASYLDDFTRGLSVNTQLSGTLGLSGSGSSNTTAYGVTTSSNGAPAPIVINLTVQGSVLTEQDLIKAVQDGLLQVGVRNNGNFTSYSGFGGG